jgi:hypothetical protein
MPVLELLDVRSSSKSIAIGAAGPLRSGFLPFGMPLPLPTLSTVSNMTLPEDLKQLLLAFNAHGVEYLVVGGWAVGFYSEPRSTRLGFGGIYSLRSWPRSHPRRCFFGALS